MAKKNSAADSHAQANRNYKDTVFRMLFADRENLLSLYNAINGRNYNNPDDLEIVTLENAIYMGMKNDLAFIVDTNIYLYEHQSTYNPNIPLRDLFYISCEYQKLVNDRSLYSPRLQKIPAPKFIVFYNGLQEKGDIVELRLSDAFEGTPDSAGDTDTSVSTGEADLELKVKMLNINEGHNRELMEQCKILREYALYVDKVREYTRIGLKLNEAVERAVDECIKAGILAHFLSVNRAEVIAVSIFEYDQEEEEKKLRKEEFDAGEKSGIAKGLAKGEKIGLEKGEQIGLAKGEQLGKEKMFARMQERGFSNMQIADLLEMSPEQIQTLKEKPHESE